MKKGRKHFRKRVNKPKRVARRERRGASKIY